MYFIILKLYLNKVDIKRVVENVSKSKAVIYRKGPLLVASQVIIIMVHINVPAILCSLEFEIGKIDIAEI